MNSLSSKTQLIKKSWTIGHGEKWCISVGLLLASQLSHDVLRLTTVNERVASLRHQVGDSFTIVVLSYNPNKRMGYVLLESLEGVRKSALTGGSIVLLGNSNVHKSSETVKLGRVELGLNTSGVTLSNMFKLKDVH